MCTILDIIIKYLCKGEIEYSKFKNIDNLFYVIAICMDSSLYFDILKPVKPSRTIPSKMLPKETIHVFYSFHTPFEYIPLNDSKRLFGKDLYFLMDMEVANVSDKSIEIQKNGKIVDGSVQIVYYIKMVIAYSDENVIETNRCSSGPYRNYAIPVSDFYIPKFNNVFNINGVNLTLKIERLLSLKSKNTYEADNSSQSGSITPSIFETDKYTLYGDLEYGLYNYNGLNLLKITKGKGSIIFKVDCTAYDLIVVGGGQDGGDAYTLGETVYSGIGGRNGELLYFTYYIFTAGAEYFIQVGGRNENSYIGVQNAASPSPYSTVSTSSSSTLYSQCLQRGTAPSAGTNVTTGAGRTELYYNYCAGGSSGGLSMRSGSSNSYSCPPYEGGYYGGGTGQAVEIISEDVYDIGSATPAIPNTGSGGAGGGALYDEKTDYLYLGKGTSGGSGIIIISYI